MSETEKAALIKHAREICKHFSHVRYDVKEVITKLCDLVEGKTNERADQAEG